MQSNVISVPIMRTRRCDKCGKKYLDIEYTSDTPRIPHYPMKRHLCPDCEWKETREKMQHFAKIVKKIVKKK